MKSIYLCLMVFLFTSGTYQDKITVSTHDFVIAEGEWKGSLTYLDYTSGKPFTMPANVKLSVLTDMNGVQLSITYPQEPRANGLDTLLIGKDGTTLNKAKIVSRKVLDDSSIQIIADMNGVDGNDNKAAMLRHIYTIGKKQFRNRKEVKFIGTDQWMMRNEYVFGR